MKRLRKDLRESQYEKFISDSKDMLSDLQDNFDDVIQEVIDSLSENFKELLDGISKTSNSAVAIIKGEMNGIGYTPTDEFKEILNGTNVVTTTQNLIDTIKDFQTKMTEYANLLANSTSNDYGYVFRGQHENPEPISKNMISCWYETIGEIIGVKNLRHLDFRHTAIKRLMKASGSVGTTSIIMDCPNLKSQARFLIDEEMNNDLLQKYKDICEI